MFEKEKLPVGAIYWGYARVSTDEQNLDLQIKALLEAGVEQSNIITDKISGSKMNRPGWNTIMRMAQPGDIVLVWKLDRLGRSVIGVLKSLEELSDREVFVKSLTEPVNTGSPMGKMLMHLIIVLAQLERDLISERTKAGIAARKAKGFKSGQKHSIADVPERMEEIARLHLSGELKKMTVGPILERLNEVAPNEKPITTRQVWYNWWNGSKPKKIPPAKGLAAYLDPKE